jgi:hypothetical protein
MLGLAVGDAAGKTLEFRRREHLVIVRGLLRLNYLDQLVDFPSSRIICLHPIAQPREQGGECRYVPAKIGRHIT